MKPKMIWANFSVKDAKRTTAFYTKLGFTANNTGDMPKLASFRFGDNGFVIHFFEEGSQIDEYLAQRQQNNSEIIFTLSADSEEEIVEWSAKIKEAGGEILQQPGRDKTNYYTMVFADPDGHKFNVLLMEKGM